MNTLPLLLLVACTPLLLPSCAPAPAPHTTTNTNAGKRLQSWSIAKVWFAGHFFSSFGDLVHAWKHDKGGMRSKFTYAFPGEPCCSLRAWQHHPGHLTHACRRPAVKLHANQTRSPTPRTGKQLVSCQPHTRERRGPV